MAKQTFTTGQVLTAAQMTSLQETAMGGGPATAKTANYVLVASDAGTTVAMNAAGATTITVNTGLFAAGDTVFIQNLGVGDLTITAGTATVATAGSLILPQNDAGILYFTSASASIFYDYIQVGAASPLTTKGDLYTFGTSDTRLGVGADGTILVADSSTPTGLAYAAPAAGGGALTFITGATFTTVSSVSLPNNTFDSTYDNYRIVFNITACSNNTETRIRLRAANSDDTTSNYSSGGYEVNFAGGAANSNTNAGTSVLWGNISTGEAQNTQMEILMMSAKLSSRTAFNVNGGKGTLTWKAMCGFFGLTTAFDSMSFIIDAGTFTGKYRVYGIANS